MLTSKIRSLASLSEGQQTGYAAIVVRIRGPLIGIDDFMRRYAHVDVAPFDQVSGIDSVFVDFTGKLVQKGQPLLTIYSPDMLASERELLLAANAKTILKNSELPSAFDQSESLLQATRRRLELWDLSEAQINQILKTGEVIKNITLYSPITGYVTDRKALPHLKVMPETDLYTIADLSHVWIMADVFEYEAPSIHVGEAARVAFQAIPGKSFYARINTSHTTAAVRRGVRREIRS